MSGGSWESCCHRGRGAGWRQDRCGSGLRDASGGGAVGLLIAHSAPGPCFGIERLKKPGEQGLPGYGNRSALVISGIACGTGMRQIEVLRLRVKDIDLERGIVAGAPARGDQNGKPQNGRKKLFGIYRAVYPVLKLSAASACP